MSDFRKRKVSVTLTGEQWFALMAAFANKGMSDEGLRIWRAAKSSMGKQVVAASEKEGA